MSERGTGTLVAAYTVSGSRAALCAQEEFGYAFTLANEGVLVNADTNIHPDLVNSRFAYVAGSRASHTTQLYVTDLHCLRESVNHDVTKTSAIDLNSGCTGLPQGISMNGRDEDLHPIQGNHVALELS